MSEDDTTADDTIADSELNEAGGAGMFGTELPGTGLANADEFGDNDAGTWQPTPPPPAEPTPHLGLADPLEPGSSPWGP